MAKITVEIECGKELCNGCWLVQWHKECGTWCGYFSDDDGDNTLCKSGGSFLRRPECKQAEISAVQK